MRDCACGGTLFSRKRPMSSLSQSPREAQSGDLDVPPIRFPAGRDVEAGQMAASLLRDRLPRSRSDDFLQHQRARMPTSTNGALVLRKICSPALRLAISEHRRWCALRPPPPPRLRPMSSAIDGANVSSYLSKRANCTCTHWSPLLTTNRFHPGIRRHRRIDVEASSGGFFGPFSVRLSRTVRG